MAKHEVQVGMAYALPKPGRRVMVPLELAGASLTIAGLATALATLSWAAWRLDGLRGPLGLILRQTGPRVALLAAGALCSAGMMVTARAAVERIAWLAALAISLYLLWSYAMHAGSVPSSTVGGPHGRSRRDRLPPWLLHLAQGSVALEPWLLLAIAPFLMFPSPQSVWLWPLLILPWIARWLVCGRPSRPSIIDWPLLLLAVMLPISWWAAVEPARSLAKMSGVVLGFAVCYGLVNHVRTSRHVWLAALALSAIGLAATVLALAGMSPQGGQPLRVPLLEDLAEHVSARASIVGGGFNPNEVGGTLSIFVPLVAGLLAEVLRSGQQRPSNVDVASAAARSRRNRWLLLTFLSVTVLVMLFTLVLTRSRSAFLGVSVGLLSLAGLRRDWRPLLLVLVLLVAVYSAVGVERTGAFLEVDHGRLEIWRHSLYMIRNFPFTGVGLNHFAVTMNNLFPTYETPAARMLALTHAHNMLLQVAAELGIPGLVAYIAVLLGLGLAWRIAEKGQLAAHLRPVNAGLLCSMVAFHVFGLTDCLALGAKPGVAVWAIWGLMAASANMADVSGEVSAV